MPWVNTDNPIVNTEKGNTFLLGTGHFCPVPNVLMLGTGHYSVFKILSL